MAKRGNVHIVAKFILAYVVLAFTLGGVFAYVYYNQFSGAAVESIRIQARASAEGIANSVDFSGFDTLQSSSDATSEVFSRIETDLLYVKDLNEHIQRIYTLRQGTGEKWLTVVDPGNAARLGTEYTVPFPEDATNALEEPSASSEFIDDVQGAYITGYAPIYNQSGQAVGLVAVDIVADDYVRLQGLLQRNVVITLIATLLFALVFGIVGIWMFNREDKRIRRALEIRNEDLEKSVKQRTKSLQEFMAVIVHDLKAPLTAMNWGLQSIEESVRKKVVKDEITELTETVTSMRQFVQTILDASKLSLGKMPIKKKSGDVVKIIEASIEEYAPKATKLGVKIEKELTKVPKFSFDAERIKQVIDNLLSNAIKFNAKKGKVSIIATYNKGSQMMHVEVTDTGPGISKKDMEGIFSAFMQAEKTDGKPAAKTKKKRSGLGLSIVQGIIEAHGGKVGVKSTIGKGSTFWFDIPTNAAETPDETAEQERATPKAEADTKTDVKEKKTAKK